MSLFNFAEYLSAYIDYIVSFNSANFESVHFFKKFSDCKSVDIGRTKKNPKK